jgi:MoxR-like ATPase
MTLALVNPPAAAPLLTEACAAAQVLTFAMNCAFAERENEISCALSALVAGEHLLLLGPPGTGKSALTDAFAGAIGGDLFNMLFTRFTVPEEVFGPISLKGLENDEYSRVTAGYAPSAQVWFLDEIFKANSAILNSLLSSLNERTFVNGGKRTRIPLELCIGASNELPADDSLGALYDRFVARCWVSFIGDRDKLRALLVSGSAPRVTAKLTREAVAVLREAREQVDVTPVVDALLDIKDELAQKHGIVPSDRRWGKAVKFVQAQAVLAGRMVAEGDDLLILANCLWDKPEERAAIYGVISSRANPDLHRAMSIYDAAVEAFGSINFGEKDDTAWTRKAKPVAQALRDQLALTAPLKRSNRVVEIEDKLRAMLQKLLRANADRRDF